MEQIREFSSNQKLSPEKLAGFLEKPKEAVIMMDGREISHANEIDFEDILESKGRCIFKIQFGAKELELIIEEMAGHNIMAHTGIENVKPKSEVLKGETTVIYQKVKEIVQEVADQLSMPIRFVLTAYPKLDNGKPNPMRSWASAADKGEALFQWDEKRVDGYNHAYFSKKFSPEKSFQ